MLQEAESSARQAAARSELNIVPLADSRARQDAVDLLNRVWNASLPLVSAASLRAYDFSGNYVHGAFRNGQMIAVAIAFMGPGHLHSDLVGVLPDGQGGGVGFALKQHQRFWALQRDLPEVRWTFDPLLRRNAYFNLHRLGANADTYLPDFYGTLVDGINGADPTDRLYVRWRVGSARAAAAAQGRLPDIDPEILRNAQVRVDRDGQLSRADPTSSNDVRLVAVPADIAGIRKSDPELASRWRYAVRTALSDLAAEGYEIVDFSPDGYYVLQPAHG